MEIDDATAPTGADDQPQQMESDWGGLLQEFSRMGTTDRDVLIQRMQQYAGGLSAIESAFFLDMNNWNLEAAVWAYFEFTQNFTPPSGSSVGSSTNSNNSSSSNSTTISNNSSSNSNNSGGGSCFGAIFANGTGPTATTTTTTTTISTSTNTAMLTGTTTITTTATATTATIMSSATVAAGEAKSTTTSIGSRLDADAAGDDQLNRQQQQREPQSVNDGDHPTLGSASSSSLCGNANNQWAVQLARSMTLVEDKTVGNGEAVTPDTPFVKTWRIRNSGPRPWPPGSVFRYVSGDMLHGDAVRLERAVAPNEEIDLCVRLLSPPEPGQYQSQWRLHDGEDDSPFGDTVWVTVQVQEGGVMAVTQQMDACHA